MWMIPRSREILPRREIPAGVVHRLLRFDIRERGDCDWEDLVHLGLVNRKSVAAALHLYSDAITRLKNISWCNYMCHVQIITDCL